MKNWIASLFDHQIDLQERTFRLISVIGESAILLMLVLAIVTGESMQDVLLILLSLVGFTGIVAFSLRFQRIQLGACVIAIILTFVILPFIFIASGGMYGGTPMWFIFAAIFVSLVIRGRIRIFFLASLWIVLSVCYLIQWYRPRLIQPHTAWMAYIDSWSSALIVGLVTSIMVIFVTRLYGEEQRIAEERRKEIEEINRAQNRFFSNMSHEIRTPVNTIIGLNEMILREAVTPEVAEYARSIQGAGGMLLTLINDVLDMSKIESGKMELVPADYEVGELLGEIVNMIWVRAKDKGLEFTVDIDETTPRVLVGDDVRIRQILINLLNNAVKYTQSGSVRLSVECKRLSGPEEGERVEMIYTVSDTGIGIRKEAMPMLFDVFRRADELKNRTIEGTGLGLSIVKQLVDLMGGEITVDSVYTRGSTFRVRIPQGVATDELIGRLTLQTGHYLGEKKEYRQSFEAPNAAILIVDDNDMNLAVASRLLTATKLCIDTAESGKECLERTQNRHYDVILMDHLMPGMDGIEVLHAIRGQEGGMNRQTPVIVLTANAGSENKALYRRSGFDGYLLKPVTGAELEEAVLAKLPPHLVSVTGISTLQGDAGQIFGAHQRKVNILITADSACDLPRPILTMHRIEIIPYRIQTDEGLFIDTLEIGTDEALSYLQKNPGKTIVPMAPTISEYESFFARMLLQADHVFHITSSAGSGHAFHNAAEAAHSFGNVTVFDGEQYSGGTGILALMAAELVETENPSPAILAEVLLQEMKNIHTFFIANSTKRLLSTGRIEPRLHTVCQSFLLKPILVPRSGGLRMQGFLSGPRNRYLEAFIRRVLPSGFDQSIRGRLEIFILTPGLPPDEIAELRAMAVKRTSVASVQVLRMSAATSLIFGQDALEIVYRIKGGRR